MKVLVIMSLLTVCATSALASHPLFNELPLISNPASQQKRCALSDSAAKKFMTEAELTKVANSRDVEIKNTQQGPFGDKTLVADYNSVDSTLGLRSVRFEVYNGNTEFGRMVQYLSDRTAMNIYGTSDCSQKFVEVAPTDTAANYYNWKDDLANGTDVNSDQARDNLQLLRTSTQQMCDAINGTPAGSSFIQTYDSSVSRFAGFHGRLTKMNMMARCFLKN